MGADRQQRIRDRAHEIWQRDGCPEDRTEAHWSEAERQIALEDTPAKKHPSRAKASKIKPDTEDKPTDKPAPRKRESSA